MAKIKIDLKSSEASSEFEGFVASERKRFPDGFYIEVLPKDNMTQELESVRICPTPEYNQWVLVIDEDEERPRKLWKVPPEKIALYISKNYIDARRKNDKEAEKMFRSEYNMLLAMQNGELNKLREEMVEEVDKNRREIK